MEILKILCIGVVGALVYVYLKSNGSELAGLSVIATGILLIISTLSYLLTAVEIFSKIANDSGVSSETFVLVVKITAISYLADFVTSLCEDLGVKSIGDKVAFAYKLIIFTLSAPVIFNLLNVISELIV